MRIVLGLQRHAIPWYAHDSGRAPASLARAHWQPRGAARALNTSQVVWHLLRVLFTALPDVNTWRCTQPASTQERYLAEKLAEFSHLLNAGARAFPKGLRALGNVKADNDKVAGTVDALVGYANRGARARQPRGRGRVAAVRRARDGPPRRDEGDCERGVFFRRCRGGTRCRRRTFCCVSCSRPKW